ASCSFFSYDPSTTEIYTLSLHDALPICIFLIASNLRNNEIFIPDVEKLLGFFSDTSFISLKKIPVSVPGDYDVRDSAEGLESIRSEEHTSELQSRENLVCRLLLEKKKIK